MEVFQEMLQSFENVQMRHAMIVHTPIVLSILGVPLMLLALLFPKVRSFRWLALVAYVSLAASAYIASQSGHDAEGMINPAISVAGDEVLQDHESMGERVWMFAAGCAVLIAVSFASKPAVRNTGGTLAVLLTVVTAGWVALVGHRGGMLVYEHQALGNGGSGGGGTDGALADPRLEFFHAQVEPILRERCWGCHNPTRKGRSGELDLTSMSGILEGGESAPEEPTVVPGSPDKSLMVTVLHYEDFIQMPPEKEGGKLSDDRIAAIERWIAEGAVWPEDLVIPPLPPTTDDEGGDDDEET